VINLSLLDEELFSFIQIKNIILGKENLGNDKNALRNTNSAKFSRTVFKIRTIWLCSSIIGKRMQSIVPATFR